MKVGNEPPQYNNRGQNPQQTQQGGYHNAPQGYQQGAQGYQRLCRTVYKTHKAFSGIARDSADSQNKKRTGQYVRGIFLNAIRPL